jgi:hypothetical protein
VFRVPETLTRYDELPEGGAIEPMTAKPDLSTVA